ncbi:MAG TPA: hypothetical protein VMN79_02780 [Casimicrobiaceae bacterium]|nr:hypothetical protein [Casimicrobiaceae bacterium]
MERTDALKWFWPFMLVAAVAAATIVALPTFTPKATADEPQFRMLVTVTAKPSDVVALTPVMLDPSCIRVLAKRPPSLIERMAGHFSSQRS